MKFFKDLFKKDTEPILDEVDKEIPTYSNQDNGDIEITESNSSNIEFSEQEKEQLLDYFVNINEEELFEIDLRKRDDLFDEAAKLVVQFQQGSTSLVQRKFLIGYNHAGRIIDELEAAGIVGPFEGTKARQVLITDENSLEQILNALKSQTVYDLKNKDRSEIFYERYKEEIDIRKSEINIKRIEVEEKIEKEKIKKQLLEKERKKKLHKEAFKELIESGEIFNEFINNEGKRESIPQEVMDKVWNRDGGKCVKCGSQLNLEFDHIIPFSKGGATTYRNVQLMCKKCNIEKSNKIG